MIRFYFIEIRKMDIELVEILKKKTTISHYDQPDNIQNMKDGLIKSEPWGVLYQTLANKNNKN